MLVDSEYRCPYYVAAIFVFENERQPAVKICERLKGVSGCGDKVNLSSDLL